MTNFLKTLRLYASRNSASIANTSPLLDHESGNSSSTSFDTQPADTILLKTRYGLRISLRRSNASTSLALSLRTDPDPSTAPLGSNSTTQELPIATPWLHIWPDYGTSFLWRQNYPEQEQVPGDDHIDDEDIEALYPAAAPYVFAWREAYEVAFRAEKCDLGIGHEPFPVVDERIAWEIEGFLIAVAIVLGPTRTNKVEYLPDRLAYMLEREGLEEQLVKFLAQKEDELSTAAVMEVRTSRL
ncbi:hypothetical protein MMC10_011418 [Thelotrema lepadinum]|nr:hypothetical protein [Thelotrema lepadinum]